MTYLLIYFAVSIIAVLITIWHTYVANTNEGRIINLVSLNEMICYIAFCFIPILNAAIIYMLVREIVDVKTSDFGNIYPFKKKPLDNSK